MARREATRAPTDAIRGGAALLGIMPATRSIRACWRYPLIVVVWSISARTVYGDAVFDYTLHCQGCHLEDGRGSAPDVPALRDSLGKLAALPGGRDYITRVPGAASAPISDARLAEVLNWVMHAFNAATLPAGFSAYTAAEVNLGRRNVLSDPMRRRAEIVAGAAQEP